MGVLQSEHSIDKSVRERFAFGAARVLFVPFDATGCEKKSTHTSYLAGKKGMGKQLSTDHYGSYDRKTKGRDIKEKVFEDNEVDTEFYLESVIDHIVHEINKESRVVEFPDTQQELMDCFDSSEQSWIQHYHYPELIFVSELPFKLKQFPDFLNLDGVPYWKIDKVSYEGGIRDTQKIAAYVKHSTKKFGLPIEGFTATHIVKESPHDVTEHVLVIEYSFLGATFKVAGVHLSSKNGRKPKYKANANTLLEFAERKQIDLFIGDFNLDVRKLKGLGPQAVKCIGYRDERLVKAANGGHGPLHLVHSSECGNAGDNKYYMGFVLINHSRIKLRGFGEAKHLGRSGPRHIEIDGVNYFYSDHPPIYVDLHMYDDSVFPNLVVKPNAYRE